MTLCVGSDGFLNPAVLAGPLGTGCHADKVTAPSGVFCFHTGVDDMQNIDELRDQCNRQAGEIARLQGLLRLKVADVEMYKRHYDVMARSDTVLVGQAVMELLRVIKGLP